MLGWNPELWQGRQAPYHCLAFPAHTLVFFKEHHGRLSKTQSHHLGQLKLCAVVLWLLPILGGAFNDSMGAGVGEELRKCIWWLTEPTCAMELSPVPFGWGVATHSSLSASFCCTVRLTKDGQRPLNPGVACPLTAWVPHLCTAAEAAAGLQGERQESTLDSMSIQYKTRLCFDGKRYRFP